MMTPRRLDNRSDRSGDDLRLIDEHDVTGVRSDDQTSSIGKRGFISL
jgi:hypothetical protein